MSSPPRASLPALGSAVLLGVLLTAVVALMAQASHWDEEAAVRTRYLMLHAAASVLFLAALWLVHRQPDDRRLLLIIGLFALAFRLILLPTPLILEDDIYRYLWDGKVVANGFNPYEFSPQEVMDAKEGLEDSESAYTEEQQERLAAVARLLNPGEAVEGDFEGIINDVNYPEVPTIYPPFSQFVFAMAHLARPGHLPTLKAFVVIFELAAIVLALLSLRATGQKQTWIVVAAWCPLLLKEFANSGHHDGLAIFAVSLAVLFLIKERPFAAGAALGLGVISKIYPVILLFVFVRRLGVRGMTGAALVIVLGYLPFLGTGLDTFEGFLTFAREWQYNGGAFALIRSLGLKIAGLTYEADQAYELAFKGAKILTGLATLVVLCLLAFHPRGRDAPPTLAALAAFGVFFYLSPVINPWYLGVLVPLLAVTRSITGLWLVLVVPLSYIRDDSFIVPNWVRLIEFLPVLPLCWWDSRRLRKRAGAEASPRASSQPLGQS